MSRCGCRCIPEERLKKKKIKRRPKILHGIGSGCALLGLVLGVRLGALLQLGDVLVAGAVGLDGLLAVGGELGLPVALARLLFGEGVLLVLVVVVVVCCWFWEYSISLAVSFGSVEGGSEEGCVREDVPSEDSLMRLTEDTAKLLRRSGLAVAAVVVIGRRAAVERMKSLDAMVVVVGKEGGWVDETVVSCVCK